MIPSGKVITGALECRRYCAPCYGRLERVMDSWAPALESQPADLRQIVKAQSGKFPQECVLELIDGTSMIPAHGTSEMPIWRHEFCKGTL
jgi:hypothetical protein